MDTFTSEEKKIKEEVMNAEMDEGCLLLWGNRQLTPLPQPKHRQRRKLTKKEIAERRRLAELNLTERMYSAWHDRHHIIDKDVIKRELELRHLEEKEGK